MITVGATVWLNSGSPPMEVEAVEDGKACVCWGGPDGWVMRDWLPLPCLSLEERRV